MNLRYTIPVILIIILITACKSEPQLLGERIVTDTASQYEYRVGLGYGFLGKAVQVTIDGQEVIAVVGTDEIEQHAQLLGTKMLKSGYSSKKDITVGVTVDDEQPYEQVLDLSTGMFIHIYNEQTRLRIYNTRFLVQE